MQSLQKKNATHGASAEAIATDVLAWLATDTEQMGRFLALSGVDAGDIRHALSDSGFLTGLLDFVMAHEPSLMAFCDFSGHKPEHVAAASRMLNGPGSAEFGW
jgi:Protein of unknown function (DUF3572)